MLQYSDVAIRADFACNWMQYTACMYAGGIPLTFVPASVQKEVKTQLKQTPDVYPAKFLLALFTLLLLVNNAFTSTHINK